MRNAEQSSPEPAQSNQDESSNVKDKKASLPWPTVAAIVVIVACQCTAARIVDLPLTRLIESRYCKRYYEKQDPHVILPDDTIPEELCKVDSVQQQLAWLFGCIIVIHVLAGERRPQYRSEPLQC